jgi:DnaK suppressor protein
MSTDQTYTLSPNYKPTVKEKFMNNKQQAYFLLKLNKWRVELLEEANETRLNLKQNNTSEADSADRASSETDRSLELRTRDRARKLVSKIDLAIGRIEDGVYGYCEETGEPIGLSRLEARPIATLSVEAQERHEKMEKTYRDE